VLDHAAARDGAARRASKGLATLCIGGGMGVAMCVERVQRSRRKAKRV
jgi:acetyl-CoA acetyltransferase